MDRLFDEAGNLITERLGSKKINKSPEKTFKCQFCEFEYDSKSGKAGHEQWCDDNPNTRKTKPSKSKTKPESKKIDVIPEKEIFYCQFCEQEWDNDRSKIQHERWCKKNPNPRQYRNKGTKIKEFEKKKQEKDKIKPKTKTSKENPIIKELKEFDKTFGLTDEQIVKYIRDKIEQ